MKFLPIKGGRETILRIMLWKVKVGERLEVEANEWPCKNPPYKIVAGKENNHFIFKYGMKADGSGWLFKRIQ
jgi:hypothetical protein